MGWASYWCQVRMRKRGMGMGIGARGGGRALAPISRLRESSLFRMFSTSSKEFLGYAVVHQRVLPGPCLWIHCNCIALPLPHPIHVSTGVKIHLWAFPRAYYLAGPGCGVAQSKQRLGPCPQGKGKRHQTWSPQSRVIRTLLNHKQAQRTEIFSQFHERENAKGEVMLWGRVPRVPSAVDLGAEHLLVESSIYSS